MPNHESMPQAVNDYNDDDYDPFGGGLYCDVNGEDQPNDNNTRPTQFSQIVNYGTTTTTDINAIYTTPTLQ